MLTAAPARQNRQPVFLLAALLLSQLLSVAQADTLAQSQTASDVAADANTRVRKEAQPLRTEENVAKGFDSIGDMLSLAYQKALRDNPNLHGKVVTGLTIDTDGSVSSCTATADEINDAAFLGEICTIIKRSNFGMKSKPWTGKHVINLLPGG